MTPSGQTKTVSWSLLGSLNVISFLTTRFGSLNSDRLVPADTILKFIEDKKLREKYGKNAREYAFNNYSIDMVIEKHLNIYKKQKGFKVNK